MLSLDNTNPPGNETRAATFFRGRPATPPSRTDTDEREAHGAHTEDERVREDSIPKLVEFLWRAVVEVAAAR